ncbi:MAG: hypothetical protein GTO45_15370 [Candidatus Aminicenantes bacterium]|nr:hypothetical protein [Candidatus Aminicenantes bacterium]NIM80148.1 hypothetical protein [Candidatus Aminicenantes bacterium]NIN19486.1 hypothetical protein [Candidatus Aminicenantes bacterium]NIN43385.1 hypothetical protein [Candidatus Aminicenantes bacterium]NIN86130.1 hypothetical protein [Candidatus Aminicenantes bacterium]
MEESHNGVFALRGGSWNNDDTNLRCSARNYNNPDNYLNNNGFRVLRAFAPNHARRCCRYLPARSGPGAGVLRNIGLVSGMT